MIREVNDWIDKTFGLNKPKETRKIYDALGFYVADERPDGKFESICTGRNQGSAIILDDDERSKSLVATNSLNYPHF